MVGWRKVALAAGLASMAAFAVNCGSSHVAPCQGAGCTTGKSGAGGPTGGGGTPPDAGTPDSGTPDAGTPDSGTPDAGTPPDSGTPDAGTPDSGIPPITFGTPGPWPAGNVIYSSADGIADGPVVGVTTDEAEYLWVATEGSLYLMKPGDKTFHRFTGADGLHLGADHPMMYCNDPGDSDASPMTPGWKCKDTSVAPQPGYGIRISTIVGGEPGEVFVGYEGIHDWSSQYDSTYQDPYRHTGMIDRVRLQPDGTIQVDRIDIDASNDWHYWHDRDIWRLAYDHFVHKHALYAGTEHGVTFFLPDQFRYPNPGENWHNVEAEYMSDHLHAHVCTTEGGCQDGSEAGQMMGDWRGLWIDPDGNLWTAGRWTAGLIAWDPNINPNGTHNVTDWSARPGDVAFVHGATFGDPYPNGGDPSCFDDQPVFQVAKEGDIVSLTAVTIADKKVWFSSGQTYSDDVALGIASFDGKCFAYYQPSQVGLGDQSVQDMVALPDGRLAIAGPTSGVVLWDPNTGSHVPLDAAHGYLADNQVKRLELDTMVNPPALHVATATGASVIRVFPK